LPSSFSRLRSLSDSDSVRSSTGTPVIVDTILATSFSSTIFSWTWSSESISFNFFTKLFSFFLKETASPIYSIDLGNPLPPKKSEPLVKPIEQSLKKYKGCTVKKQKGFNDMFIFENYNSDGVKSEEFSNDKFTLDESEVSDYEEQMTNIGDKIKKEDDVNKMVNDFVVIKKPPPGSKTQPIEIQSPQRPIDKIAQSMVDYVVSPISYLRRSLKNIISY